VGMGPIVPKGAYYILADVSKIPGVSSKERALWLLSKTKVASVPGSAFYSKGNGESFVRYCFAKDTAILKRSIDGLNMLNTL